MLAQYNKQLYVHNGMASFKKKNYINMDSSQCRSTFAQNLVHAHIFRFTQTVGYAQLMSKISCYNEPMAPCALHTLAV